MRGRVVWVVDRDTIHVQIGTRRERVRDIGINAPEIPHAVRGWQHGGEQAAGNRTSSGWPTTVGCGPHRADLPNDNASAAHDSAARTFAGRCHLPVSLTGLWPVDGGAVPA